jgi:hypothetical protein
VAGCAGSKATSGSSRGKSSTSNFPANSTNKVIITPDTTPFGKVVRVNNDSRFVVLGFPLGAVPTEGKSLSVYRQGLKVGELKVSGPRDEEHTVANITSGTIQVGDEARGN